MVPFSLKQNFISSHSSCGPGQRGCSPMCYGYTAMRTHKCTQCSMIQVSTEAYRTDYMCDTCREVLPCSKCTKTGKRRLFRGRQFEFVCKRCPQSFSHKCTQCSTTEVSTSPPRVDYMCVTCREVLPCSKCTKTGKRRLFRGRQSEFVCKRCPRSHTASSKPIQLGSIGLTGAPPVIMAGPSFVSSASSVGMSHRPVVFASARPTRPVVFASTTRRQPSPGVDFGVLQWKR